VNGIVIDLAAAREQRRQKAEAAEAEVARLIAEDPSLSEPEKADLLARAQSPYSHGDAT